MLITKDPGTGGASTHSLERFLTCKGGVDIASSEGGISEEGCQCEEVYQGLDSVWNEPEQGLYKADLHNGAEFRCMELDMHQTVGPSPLISLPPHTSTPRPYPLPHLQTAAVVLLQDGQHAVVRMLPHTCRCGSGGGGCHGHSAAGAVNGL